MTVNDTQNKHPLNNKLVQLMLDRGALGGLRRPVRCEAIVLCTVTHMEAWAWYVIC